MPNKNDHTKQVIIVFTNFHEALSHIHFLTISLQQNVYFNIIYISLQIYFDIMSTWTCPKGNTHFYCQINHACHNFIM